MTAFCADWVNYLLGNEKKINTQHCNSFSCVCSHFKFLSVYDEYTGSDISDQMESICLLGTFLSRCNDTLNNLCSQIIAIFNEEIVNLSKFLYYYLF